MNQTLAPQHRQYLLDLARRAVRHGLEHRVALPVELAVLDAPLREVRATFVTLRQPDGELQGCIGMLRATRPLAEDVAQNAYAAAFDDPRGQELDAAQVEHLDIHISVLSPLEELPAASEAELVEKVRPGVDGLVISDLGSRGTLLPSVWESLPEPLEFVRHVKQKAGLLPEHWSPQLKVWRYTTESFGTGHD